VKKDDDRKMKQSRVISFFGKAALPEILNRMPVLKGDGYFFIPGSAGWQLPGNAGWQLLLRNAYPKTGCH